jgi:hypothetical protein
MTSPRWLPYPLYICRKCKSQIMNLLEESVSIPLCYGECNTYEHHGATGCITITGLAKQSGDTWKLSNNMRRMVRDKIIKNYP